MKKSAPGSTSHIVKKPAPIVLTAELRALLDEAQTLERRQVFEAAMLKHMQALALEPKLTFCWIRISYILLLGLRWQEAIESLQTALVLEPDSVEALRFMAYAHYNLGRLEEARATIEKAASRSSASEVWVLRAWILAAIDKDPKRTLQAFRDWGVRAADPLTRTAQPLVVADRSPRRKLKVGYVTADFRRHSVAFFMLPVLEHHDPEEVEIHVFSSGRADDFTAIMQKHVKYWHNVIDMNDEELCRFIRAMRIDVLVDLSGHTLGQRLGTFARRAAPVQVTWLGFMNPLGMQAMDYRLTDHGTNPFGTEPFYSETLMRLECMASYAPPGYAPLRESLPMDEKGHPTLISLNNSVKVTHEMLQLWTRILARRPDARLVIMVKEKTAEAAQAAMQHRVEAAGMPLDRVFVMHQQSLENFMELGHVADLALDTSPVSGGTTTLHALWMGLPVVAMDAERSVDASTARTLQGIGLEGWVAADEDGYIEKVLELLDDREALLEHRATARERLRTCVLMDYAARTAELEKAYRLMWIAYLQGQVRAMDVRLDLETEYAALGAGLSPQAAQAGASEPATGEA
ncbi:MAG: tetratricopeptide repeat protein [Pseudomonadota bacterium]